MRSLSFFQNSSRGAHCYVVADRLAALLRVKKQKAIGVLV